MHSLALFDRLPCFAVICHMEGSGKWPHDRLAIRHIRAAFHIQLGELLTKEHKYTCRPCPTHLDVWKVGVGFFLCIKCNQMSMCNRFYWIIFLISVCAGWLVVPGPGGVPPRASGAEGECDRWGDVNCEGQRGSTSFGDGHHSQTSAHKHTARVLTLP